MKDDTPHLYSDLASWWPLFSKPSDYAEEAGIYHRIFCEASPRPSTVLELGCGGGNNASHLKAHYRLTLVDLSEAMLAVSRKLNPECEHVAGDMRTVRLDGVFDAVFVHDAVVYLTTEDDLARAIETAWVHCAPGGIALFCPDHVKETFRPSTSHGGHDSEDRGIRYLEWMIDPDSEDTVFEYHFAYLLREPDGTVRTEYDCHRGGVFPRATWIALLEAAGFAVEVRPFGHSELEPGSQEMFIGRKG